MKITRDNYEPFFLDYLEGNLDPGTAGRLTEFLRLNPDLEEELISYENITLPVDNSEFRGKALLRRTDPDDPPHLDIQAIAMLEGDLPENEKRQFAALTRTDPNAARRYESYKRTLLAADPSITFTGKEKLYRQPAFRPVYAAIRVAAVLLVAVAIGSLWPPRTDEIHQAPAYSEVQTIQKPPAEAEPPQVLSGNILRTDASDAGTPPASTPARVTRQAPAPQEQLAGQSREEIQVPDRLVALKASPGVSSTETSLMAVHVPEIPTPREEAAVEDDLYLTDRLKQQVRLEGFTFSRLIRSGLDLASGISGDKVSYTTNVEGNIVALSLDTRLVGLKIPVGNK